jgi:hypothetical protein
MEKKNAYRRLLHPQELGAGPIFGVRLNKRLRRKLAIGHRADRAWALPEIQTGSRLQQGRPGDPGHPLAAA